MAKYKPLYRESINDAREMNQLPLWRESHAANKQCRDILDSLIAENWDGMHLADSTAQKAIDESGFDRVMWVLANHLQHNKHDTRFHSENRSWARTINIPRPAKSQLQRDPYLTDHSTDYLLQSHAVKVNDLTDKVREMYAGLNMYDYRHRLSDSDGSDYTGKILILRASSLNSDYKSPEFQLFRADSGFGCSPTSSGRAVFGKFLIDGEAARFERNDFVGVLDEQYLPEWAKEKLQQQGQAASDAPEEGSQPVMKSI